jgi:hypothetical protein
MREKSHIDAMRAAVKGDLERARSRNPSIFERPARPPAVPEPEPVREPEPVLAVEPEPPVVVPSEPKPEIAVEPEPEPKPGLLARLAFWR